MKTIKWHATYTTCKCGKSVELKKGMMSWIESKCKCGTNIRLMRGKMIIETQY